MKTWKYSLVLILFSHMIWAKTFHGTIQKLVLDDFSNRNSSIAFLLITKSDKYQLNLPRSFKKQTLTTGMQVTINGNLQDNFIDVEDLKVVKKQKTNKKFNTQRSVISFLINFLDKRSTDDLSVNAVDSFLFSPPSSVTDIYYASSLGQIKFIRLPGANNTPPVYQINLNYNAGNSCNYVRWAIDAANVATQSGININNYLHRVYYLPAAVNCGFGGIAYVGCLNFCEAWVLSYFPQASQGLTAHELGHNLNLLHSSTDFNNDGIVDDEYGDNSDVMATGFGSYSQISGAHRNTVFWYNSFPNQVINVSSSGQYIINSLDKNTLNMPQVLKINAGSWGSYYVELRTNVSPFPLNTPYVNKVMIHHVYPGSTQTLLVAILGQGQTFSDPARGVNINIPVIVDGCSATVNVNLG